MKAQPGCRGVAGSEHVRDSIKPQHGEKSAILGCKSIGFHHLGEKVESLLDYWGVVGHSP